MSRVAGLIALFALATPQVALAEGCPATADGVRSLLQGRKVLRTQAQGGFAQDGFTDYEGSGLVFGVQPLGYELQTKSDQVRELRIYLPGTSIQPYSHSMRNAHSGATCESDSCEWRESEEALGALESVTMMETIYRRDAMTLWCRYANSAGW